MNNIRKLAIIGVGPRGGYALENLLIELKKRGSISRFHILLFEETGYFGNGAVYDVDQTETNWINISERILLLDRRPKIESGNFNIPSFPSYHEWANYHLDRNPDTYIDTYPPRAKIGQYLNERFRTLSKPLINAGVVTLLKERVENVVLENHNNITLITASNEYRNINEILLTLGHQPTKISQQIQEWDEFATNKNNIGLYKNPYPIASYLNSEILTDKSIIGVRGFGLAMIDVVRGIAEKFGQFITEDESDKSCRYQEFHKIKNLFLPFSLDGLPPAPKPLNAEIDEWFKPTADQLSTFENKISNNYTQKDASSPEFLISAFAPIAANIYSTLPQAIGQEDLSLEEIEKLVENWLKNDKYQHPVITPKEQSAYKTMQDFVGMAIGKEAISLDYCIGQVWRYCQPSIYEKLSFNKCSEKVCAEIIALDEGTKRYSYGPPVESIQQMLALIEARVMTLEMVNNPKFQLMDDGWCFLNNSGKSITANMMINSVLDSPKIESVRSPIVKNMLSNDLIEAVHDELGVMTDENGYVISQNIEKQIPIAMLGRLAKGTIIGVDAILECFGSRPKNWALAASKRHEEWLGMNEVI